MSLVDKLPEHVLIEILIRVPICEWPHLSCVKKQWAHLFRQDLFWNAALVRNFPLAAHVKPWPGPIPQGFTKRRYAALYISKHMFSVGEEELDEIVGHVYLFLKEQLQISNMPPLSAVLHATIIDQFIACGKSRDVAHELASIIWLAVVDNLEENEQTFNLLKRLASEGDVSKILGSSIPRRTSDKHFLSCIAGPVMSIIFLKVKRGGWSVLDLCLRPIVFRSNCYDTPKPFLCAVCLPVVYWLQYVVSGLIVRAQLSKY